MQLHVNTHRFCNAADLWPASVHTTRCLITRLSGVSESELQRTTVRESSGMSYVGQMKEKGLIVNKWHIQDATFVEANIGRKRYQKEKKIEKRGERINYTPKQLVHIDGDSSFSVKSSQVHYSYKGHTKSDINLQLIHDMSNQRSGIPSDVLSESIWS